MQTIFTLALVLNAFLGGCAAADAKSSSLPAPVPSLEDAAAPQAAALTRTEEVRLNALGRVSAGGNAPTSIIARRNVDGDYSYQHSRFSVGRRGQPPQRKMNT